MDHEACQFQKERYKLQALHTEEHLSVTVMVVVEVTWICVTTAV
jgi:hypothetical protein